VAVISGNKVQPGVLRPLRVFTDGDTMSESHPRLTSDPADPERPKVCNVRPNPSTQIMLGDPSDCPFPAELLTRHFGFDGMPLTPEKLLDV
jgi:hypothetical protein